MFGRGEVHRLRDEDGDPARALADLDAASRLQAAPAVTFRSLGLLHRQRNDAAAAALAFEAYLSRLPGAPDAAMVRAYLAELKS